MFVYSSQNLGRFYAFCTVHEVNVSKKAEVVYSGHVGCKYECFGSNFMYTEHFYDYLIMFRPT